MALLGKDPPDLSPAVISRLTAEWQGEYSRWQKRDLSARRYVSSLPTNSTRTAAAYRVVLNQLHRHLGGFCFGRLLPHLINPKMWIYSTLVLMPNECTEYPYS
jgi:hypothetical protein